MAIFKRLTLACAGALLLATSPLALATTTLKLSHNQGRDHPVHKAMLFLAKKASEYSGGDLRIRIYPDAQLGTQRESLELLQNGALDMAKSNASELESFAPAYGAFNLPYLFRDREHFYQVIQGPIGEKILQSSRKQGFIGLTYYDAGARSFYAKKPINSPADLKGLKVRVQPSPTAIEMVKLLGANPTPLAYGELYTALQQGVVDAAENNITALTLSRHGEVAKYSSLDEHARVPDVLVISTKIWDKLSPKDQKALKKAAADSTVKMKELWANSEAKETKKAEKMGVKFIHPDKSAFVKAVQPMYDALKAPKAGDKDADLSIYTIVKEIKATK